MEKFAVCQYSCKLFALFPLQGRMDNFACPFGALFREHRTTKQISLWQVIHRLGYYPANIQRIEAGLQHPGVLLALRFLQAIDVDAGIFMQELSERNVDDLPQSLASLRPVDITYEVPVLGEGQKSFFGLFLRQARIAAGISQTAMARAAHYNLRNIKGVETGRQDRAIMTALTLVVSTGVDARQFFSVLSEAWKEQQARLRPTGRHYPACMHKTRR